MFSLVLARQLTIARPALQLVFLYKKIFIDVYVEDVVECLKLIGHCTFCQLPEERVTGKGLFDSLGFVFLKNYSLFFKISN